MRTILDKEVLLIAEKELLKMGKAGTTSRKLQAVIASCKHGIKKVSEVMGVSRTSIYLWAKEIKQRNIRALENKAKHKEGLKLKPEHKEKIKEWLLNCPNLTISEVKDRLKGKCGIDVSKSTVHRAMKSSGFSYITGRKQHYKQDKKLVRSFKK